MPLYAYHCETCSSDFETLVRSSEEAACPRCESTKLSRMLSLIARPARGGESSAAMACAPHCAQPMAGQCGAASCCFASD